MQRIIASLTLAIAFLAAPTLGIAAMDACPPCCAQADEAPCEAEDAPCLSVAVVSCCEAQPAKTPPEAKRQIDPKNGEELHPSAPRSGAQYSPSVSPTRPPDADLALRTSPLRLSVVLLI